MASAVPENERDTAGEIAIFETATETMACYIGYLRNQIREESKQSVPNEAEYGLWTSSAGQLCVSARQLRWTTRR